MKVSMLTWAFIFLVAFVFAVPMQANAEGLSQDMTQGQFASWLVKAMGAQGQLSPGATGQDAIDFLFKIGVVPEEGWDEEAKIDRKFLASLLGDPGAASMDFNALVDKLVDYVKSTYSLAQTGVFRAFSGSSSASVIPI